MLPQACTKAWPPFQWGSDTMANVPPAVDKAVQMAKAAQIIAYIKDNQLLTAVCLFVLWQAGAFLTAIQAAQGAVC
jgi:hypothetical protein